MIKSASRSSITNDQKYRSMLAGTVPSSEYLIDSRVLDSSASIVSFNNIDVFSGVYKHFQIVITARSSRASIDDQITLHINDNVGTNYAWHRLLGNGSTVSSTGATSTTTPQLGAIPANSATANIFGGLIVDLLDPYSSTKSTTVRSLNGFAGNWIALHSILYINKDPVDSIQMTSLNGNFMIGSRFSLYGVTA